LSRLAHYFVTACIAVVSICVALALYAAQDFALLPSAVVGGGAFAFLLLVRDNHLAQRQRIALGEMLDDDKAAIGALVGRAEQIETRLKAIEARMARMTTDPTAADIATLGGLVKQLADTIAEQEAKLAGLTKVVGRRPEAPSIAAPTMTSLAGPLPEAPIAAEPAALTPRDVVEAIEREQIEVHLQVIVGLPQRKPKLYDAQPRLKLKDGRLLTPSDYRMTAGALGRLEGLDALHFQRCVQVVRRLGIKNRDLTVICNLSLRSLSATILADEAIRALEATPMLSGQLVFGFSQAAIQSMGRSEADCLTRLSAAGYRFAMDSITDLRLDAKALSAKGFRFMRVAASTLLAEAPAGTEIHVADLSGLLSRFGIDLIAEGVASETAVVDLLDFDLRFAQGPLFGALRPVRADLFGDEAPAAAPIPENPTLGEAALQGMIEKMRKAQEEKQAAAGQKPGSRSGWRALARQVGSRERA